MFGAVNFPAYRQLDQMDCGPTCLKIITEYYGRHFSLNFLREISSQQKGGVSFQDLSGAVGEMGLVSGTNILTLKQKIQYGNKWSYPSYITFIEKLRISYYPLHKVSTISSHVSNFICSSTDNLKHSIS